MPEKQSDLPLLLGLCAMALLALAPLPRRPAKPSKPLAWGAKENRPFAEPRGSNAPRGIALLRAQERGRGRRAIRPLQIPWQGWRDILWRTFTEMNSDRLLSVAGGVAFFILLAIFPAITALVSAYGLFFNASTITDNFSLLQGVVPANVLSIVQEQADRIASNSHGVLSTGIVWSVFWCRCGAP